VTSARRPETAELLAHRGWLRALARGLVADAHAADDVVQESLLTAIERPPRAGAPLRLWLAAVAHNLVRQEHRSRARREAREALAARPDADVEHERARDRIEIARVLLGEVDSLGEPWRALVVARYLEGEPPRVIAARTGVPSRTVKKRLSRALELLRERLDRRHESDRRAWMLALLPLSRRSISSGLCTGSLLMSMQTKSVLAAIAVVCASLLAWRIGVAPIGPSPLSTEPEAPVDLVGADDLDVAGPTAATAERAPVGRSEAGASKAPAATPRPPITRGRVIDAEGRPVAGVSIVPITVWREPLAPPEAQDQQQRIEPLAVSDADGSFELARPPDCQALGASEPGWTTVLAANVWNRRFDLAGLAIVIAPRIAVSGAVVDGEGRAAEGATVRFVCDPALGSRLAVVPAAVFEVPRAVTASSEGRFELQEIPAVRGSLLSARAPGCTEGTAAAPTQSSHAVRIVLARDGSTVVRGEVRDARGSPVEGAWVALRHETAGGADAGRWSSSGNATAKTDANGRFAVDAAQGPSIGVAASPRGGAAGRAPASQDTQVLLAVAPGSLPARLARPESGWPDLVTLELGGAPLEIHGQVVDASGAPVAGARVWTIDETDFGNVWDPLFGPSGGGLDHSLETVIRGRSRGRGSTGTVRSDDRGRFVLAGLLPRSYRLGCIEDETLLTAVSAPVEAGAREARLALEAPGICARVAGRVVSPRGEPIEGAEVEAGRPIARWPWIEFPQPLCVASARTDAEGQFVFERIATKDLALIVVGETIWTPGFWRPPAGSRLDELSMRVRRSCPIQIDLGNRPDLAEGFEALTEDGRRIEILWNRGSSSYSRPSFPIEDGRSEILFVPEDARTIVLTKAGNEAARLPIVPEPGQLSTVRP